MKPLFQFGKKLLCYPEKLRAFLEGDYTQTLSTVLLHLSADICNHNCAYCDKYSHEANPQRLTRGFLRGLLDDLQEMGADSVIILGEGAEPLLCPDFCWFVETAAERGFHCGLYTNGSVCTPEIISALNKMDFVRFSLDAGDAATHSRIHRCPRERGDFENALHLIESVDKTRCSVGVAYIVMPENAAHIFETWQMLNELHAHFLELKLPLMDGYQFDSENDALLPFVREAVHRVGQQRAAIHGTESTRLVLNKHLDDLINDRQSLDSVTQNPVVPCLTCAFRCVVSPFGYYQCSPRKLLPEYCFGHPASQTLLDAWNSPAHLAMIGSPCATRCTYDEQNRLLLDLRSGKPFSVGDDPIPETQKHFL